MIYVVNTTGNLIFISNVYHLGNKEKIYLQLVSMGYDPAKLNYYDETSYYAVYPDRKTPTDMEVLTAKVDYISMVVEGLVLNV